MRRPLARARLGAMLGVAAAACWLAALRGPAARGGEPWLLEDRSASMAGRVAPPALRDGVAGARQLRFADGVAGVGAADPPDAASRLGAALAALRPRLRAGDELRIWSDGAATDDLPGVAGFAGVALRWQAPPSLPRIVGVDAPAALPAGGRFEIAVRVAEGDPAAGALEVAALSPARLDGLHGLSQGATAGGAETRVEVELAAPVEQGVTLRLRWREGSRDSFWDLHLAAPGRIRAWAGAPPAWLIASRAFELVAAPAAADLLCLRAAPFDRDAAAAALARGAVVALAGAEASAWAALPAGLQPLQPQGPPAGALTILLDASGSMDGRPYAEAGAVLAEWAAAWPEAAALRVVPFAAEPGVPLDPRRPAELAALRRRVPFGPTGLAEALAVLRPLGAEPEPLLIVSDGRAAAPPAGWGSTARALAVRFDPVLCVPVGEAADLATLGALGELVTSAGPETLAARLRRSLDGLQGRTSGVLGPVPGGLWTVPAELQPLGARPRLRASHGAEALLRGAEGDDAAALRRVGRGLLVGYGADFEDPSWGELLPPLLAEWRQPRLRRQGGWLELDGEGTAWRAGVEGERPFAFDRSGVGIWRAGPFDERRAWVAWPPGGAPIALPPVDAEATAGAAAWRAWLAAHSALPAVPRADPRWLAAALLLATAAWSARGTGRFRSPASE